MAIVRNLATQPYMGYRKRGPLTIPHRGFLKVLPGDVVALDPAIGFSFISPGERDQHRRLNMDVCLMAKTKEELNAERVANLEKARAAKAEKLALDFGGSRGEADRHAAHSR